MMIDLSLNELIFLRTCVTSAPTTRLPLPPAAFGIAAKLDNIIVAAQCAEGQKYIREEP